MKSSHWYGPGSNGCPPSPFTHQLQLDLGTHRLLPHGRKAAREGLPHATDALQDGLGDALQACHRAADRGHFGPWQKQLLQSISIGKDTEQQAVSLKGWSSHKTMDGFWGLSQTSLNRAPQQ